MDCDQGGGRFRRDRRVSVGPVDLTEPPAALRGSRGLGGGLGVSGGGSGSALRMRRTGQQVFVCVCVCVALRQVPCAILQASIKACHYFATTAKGPENLVA